MLFQMLRRVVLQVVNHIMAAFVSAFTEIGKGWWALKWAQRLFGPAAGAVLEETGMPVAMSSVRGCAP